MGYFFLHGFLEKIWYIGVLVIKNNYRFTMKASDLFVKALENEGIEYIFGIPGEENLDMLESLRTSKIKLVVTRHEQAAGFMAATYGRLTGNPGVCISTLGPGATNFVTAAAYAQLGAMPMMMITGQKPIKKSKQGSFQIVDIVQMMKPITKFTKQIVNANNIPALVRKAVKLSMEERPGAVHLEFPEDIADEQVDAQVFAVSKVRRPVAEEKAIIAAAEMIKAAKSPLLLIGAGANRKLTSKMLTEFVDKLGIPFFTTQMGKGVIDERHARHLGTASLSANDYLHCAIDKADLIINVGHDVIEKPPFFMKHDGAKVIHVNFLPAEPDQVYFPQLEVVGDIANAIWQLTEKLEVQSSWDFNYFMSMKAKIDEHIAAMENDGRFPLAPQRIVADVRKLMPDNGIIALDNGMYKLWFSRNYRAYERNTVLLDNALATMGAGLPSGMMAKMVYPDRKVLVIAGDGGFMMNSQEIETAVRLGLDLVVMIINDSGYGMIKWKQAGMGFENYGLDYQNPDFVKYAKSYGAQGHRVESADDLLPTLEKAFKKGGVHVVEVPVDYTENDRVFNKELQQLTCNL